MKERQRKGGSSEKTVTVTGRTKNKIKNQNSFKYNDARQLKHSVSKRHSATTPDLDVVVLKVFKQ